MPGSALPESPTQWSPEGPRRVSANRKSHLRSVHSAGRQRLNTLIRYSQPILADEVQTFKALITIHKVLQEGDPITIKEAQNQTGWLESLTRGVSGDGHRGASLTSPLERGNIRVSFDEG